MRIRCLQENLSKGLSLAGRVTSTRSSLPVLANILVEAREGQVRLVCSNLDISINVWINAAIEEEGAITIPVRLLTEFVTYLPPHEEVTLVYDVKARQVKVSSGHNHASFNTIEATEFPAIPDSLDGDTTPLQLGIPSLRSMIDQTVFAASTGIERPNLTGVEMHFTQGQLIMAATDGFRLSVRTAPLNLLVDDELKVLVPARALSEMSRILAEADQDKAVQMAVTHNSNQVLFAIPGLPQDRGAFAKVLLLCQLIDAQFPDYKRIIPTEHESRIVTSTENLLQAAKVSFLFTKEHNNIITTAVDCESNCISISSESNEKGDSNNKIDATVEGDSITISFNGQYLIDALNHMHSEDVVLEMTQPTRPCKVKPVGQGDDQFLHIIMPMSHPR